MTTSQRVICVEIERPVPVVEMTAEERIKIISECLMKAEMALESGDIDGGFNYFKEAAKAFVNRGKEAVDKAKQKATDVYKKVQDIKPGYKVELPERFFKEMDDLVKYIHAVKDVVAGPDPVPDAPSAPEYQPAPSAPEYQPDPSAPPYPTAVNPAPRASPPHAGHPMYYLVRGQ